MGDSPNVTPTKWNPALVEALHKVVFAGGIMQPETLRPALAELVL